MTHAILFSFVPSWVSNWLTPLWILGVGATMGLALVLAVWLATLVLSRIAAVDRLASDPARRAP
jgi:uncharacterized membrane protein (DUF485 family)